MKKILFICLIALFASCSAEEELLQGMSAESTAMLKELENVTNGYELMIKGYSLEELQREKDETPKSNKVETTAEPWMIKAIRDSLDKTILSYGNKTRADAQPYGGEIVKVGVFKYGSCGNHREFVYFMDCEDDGNSHANGNIGSSEVGGNVVFRFCLVNKANYGGGVLLLSNYQWKPNVEGNISIVERYHDNEDRRNKNKVEDYGGLPNTGPTHFSANTKFFWFYLDEGDLPISKLPFTYGVLAVTPPNSVGGWYNSSIFIDDEDSSNGNEAILREHNYTNTVRYLKNDEYYKGILPGRNTEYFIRIIE